MPFISTPFNCLFAVCIVVVCLMLLVDVVNCNRPKNDNSADANERKQAKYEDFKCYGQTLAQNEMEGVVCNPKDKPKGCISLRGCKVTNGDFDYSGQSAQKHDFRSCIMKSFLKSIEKGLKKVYDEKVEIEATDICPVYLTFCDDCKVCHPKKEDGDYCNGDGTNKGGTTEGSHADNGDTSDSDGGITHRGVNTVLVSILAFGATLIGTIWMRLGI